MRRIVALLILLTAASVPAARAQDPGLQPAPTEPPAATTTVAPPTTSAEPPPAPTQPSPVTDAGLKLIADGVTISGVMVGGMTGADASVAVQEAFEQPLQFTHKKRRWWAAPERLGARAYVAGAVQRALLAPPGAAVDLVVSVKGAALDDYIAFLNRNFARRPRDAALRLVNLRPRLSKPREGFDIAEATMKAAIVRALKNGDRGPLALLGTVLKPAATLGSFGPIIVIRRESRRLYLYDGQRFVRRFSVGVGQPEYPTPIGRFEIVVKQRDPWWYPPPDSDWAAGQEPVPPGPGNPLGTRWMGLSAPLVGIHGTPDAASVGYSVSHGCIRMLVPEAEWLFERVEIGAPVFIVKA